MGHPYPLLMALKPRARAKAELALDAELQRQLRSAERMRLAQAEADPPLDSPWCFFDLAEIRLYADDPDGFLKWLRKGVQRSEHDWEPGTFRSALQLLVDGGVKPAGLDTGLAELDAAKERLK